MTTQPIHTYIDGVRHHNTPLGALPGVTSVLGETKDRYSKKAIESWQEKVGAVTASGILANSLKRGDQLHATIEAFLGDTPPKAIGQQSLACWNLVRPFIENVKEKAEDLYIERHTYHELGYAGTPDLVCKMDGKYVVMDWKNSRKPKKRSYIKDYLMQVAAYSRSHEFVFGNKIESAIIVCAVVPDQYLSITNPGLVVEPELQLFKVTTKSLNTHWNNFNKRLEKYKELKENPIWIDNDSFEEDLPW